MEIISSNEENGKSNILIKNCDCDSSVKNKNLFVSNPSYDEENFRDKYEELEKPQRLNHQQITSKDLLSFAEQTAKGMVRM